MNIKQIASIVFLASAVFVASNSYSSATNKGPDSKVKIQIYDKDEKNAKKYEVFRTDSLDTIKDKVARDFGIPVEQVKFERRVSTQEPDEEKEKVSHESIDATKSLSVDDLLKLPGATYRIKVISAQ